MVPQQKTCGNGHRVFFRGFLRQPALIGSVIPSSRFLERRIVEAAGIANSRMVVELGPGTGGTTRAILRALPRRAHLLAIEINPEFVNYLKAYPDPRLDVYLGSAEHAQGSGNSRPYPAGRYRVRQLPSRRCRPKLDGRSFAKFGPAWPPGGASSHTS